MQSLAEKYRPKVLTDLIGQDWIVESLAEFVCKPYSQAFIFSGATGTGKTSAAFCLARELGCGQDDDGEFSAMGGFTTIASGEQTGESVRSLMEFLRYRPMQGSGWKVVVINEADYMTGSAAQLWLDGLENLPSKTVICFTTNKVEKLPKRFRDRCETFHFESGAMLLARDAQALVEKVWVAEGFDGDPPAVEDFDYVDENGDLSFRSILQQLGQMVRGNGKQQRRAVTVAG